MAKVRKKEKLSVVNRSKKELRIVKQKRVKATKVKEHFDQEAERNKGLEAGSPEAGLLKSR